MPMSTDSSALSIAVGARSLARLTAAQVEVRGKALDLVAATDLLITAAGVFGTRSPSVAAFHHCAAKTRHMKLRRSMSPRQMHMLWVAQVNTSARESHDMIGATGTAATAPRCTASSWDLEHAQGLAAA